MTSPEREQVPSERFRLSYEALQKAADGSRKTIYVFAVIFAAMLLWTLNAVIYPAEQRRLIQIQAAAADTVACLERFTQAPALDDDCRKRLARERLIGGGNPSESARALEQHYISEQISTAYASSARTAQFSVPLLGIVSDRTWLWLVNAVLSLLLYYILRDSLLNTRNLLEYTLRMEPKTRLEIELLRSTQVVTASRGRSANVAKFALLGTLFGIPLITTGLFVYDWSALMFPPLENISSAHVGSAGLFGRVIHYNTHFLGEPEGFGGLLNLLAFAWEVPLWIAIVGTTRRLSIMSREIATWAAALPE